MTPATTSRPQPVPAAGPGGAVLAAGHGAPGHARSQGPRSDCSVGLFIGAGNLVWELAQLPLYTIWDEGTPGEIAFAVAHCTGGDILIAGASLLLALLIAARPSWPHETYWRVAALTVAFAVPYTVFSEWLHTEVRGSWAYSELMPVVPVLDAGVSPLAQVDRYPDRRLLVAAPLGSEGKPMRITRWQC